MQLSPPNNQKSFLGRISEALFRPVSASTLVAFRFFFGLIMGWEVFRYWPRIERYYLQPEYLFKYDFFHWITLWPGEWIYAHFLITGLAAAGVALGVFYRFSALVLWLGFSYIFLLEQANYLNHIYFVNLIAFLMIFLSANSCYSVDSYFLPEIRSRVVPQWNIWILQFQIGAVYFFGGIAKMNSDWIHGEPLRNWLAKRGHYEYIGPYLTQWWSPYFFSWGGLILDLTIPFLLLYRRTRLPAVLAVFFFHIMNSQIFTIGIFPWMMLAATLIFFRPDSLEKWLPCWLKKPEKQFSYQRSTIALLSLYCLIQIYLPLRHHLFPGDVAWTEEGHRFAWRMKLRDKAATLMFSVFDPETKRTLQIHPVHHGHITKNQYDSMSGRPDMFFQYIQFLKMKMNERGITHPVIKSRYLVSLNGRAHKFMVDPERDLSTLTYSPLTHSDWILPLPEGLKPGEYRHIRLLPAFESGKYKRKGSKW